MLLHGVAEELIECLEGSILQKVLNHFGTLSNQELNNLIVICAPSEVLLTGGEQLVDENTQEPE